jgi:hypothetical protein
MAELFQLSTAERLDALNAAANTSGLLPLAYAGIHLAIVLPIYLFLLPREPKRHPATTCVGDGVNKTLFKQSATPGAVLLFALLAIAITLSAMISTVMSVHLLTIL